MPTSGSMLSSTSFSAAGSSSSPPAGRSRGRGISTTPGQRKHRCQICARLFDRKDTLSRHMQVHDKNRPPPVPRKKSCAYCFKSKIKCSGGYPTCGACLRRGLPCAYAVAGATARIRAPNQPQPQPQPQPTTSESVSQSAVAPYINIQNITDSGSMSDNGLLSPQSSTEVSGSDSDHNKLYTAASLSEMQDNTNGQDALFSGAFGFESFGYSDLSDCIQDSSLNWMFRSALDDNFSLQFLDTSDHPGIDENNLNPLRDLSEQQAGRNSLETQIIEQENSGAMEQLELPPLGPRNRCDPDDPWPMEWYASSLQNAELPMLGRAGEAALNGATYFGMDPISSATRAKMLNHAQSAFERTLWPAINLNNFPSEEKLDHCVDLYFAHFHRTLPIIHRPTFDTAKDPVVVTLAIACIGACYTEFDGARSFSNSLSELNRRLLLFMSEQDRRFVRTEFYITAQLLQGTHGYSCGNKRLFELSDAFRSSLVSNARCMGLFQDRPATVPANDSDDARWHAWIADERIRRLAWAVYEYDSSVSFLHNTRPCLSVSEMKLALPSSLALWEADSAHVWMSLHPWSESTPDNLPFKPTIRSLFESSEAGPGKIADDQHQLIIVLTLTRMLWSVKEFEASPINDLVRETHSLRESKRNLQEVLDRFLLLQVPTAKKTLSSFVRKLQIIHMSHLYSAGDLMDFIRPLLRGRHEAEGARTRMMSWGAQDPVRVRSTAYHSAQTLAIVRSFPHNEPLEAFNVFHAGVVLWCAAGLLSQGRTQEPIDAARLGKVTCAYRIDAANARSLDSTSLVDDDWIQHGGSQVVSLYGVPDLCCSRGQIQVLEQTAEILERMQVWGIAQNFLLVVLQMIQREEERSNARA